MSNEAARLCEEGLELMTQHRWNEAEEKMGQALEEDPKSPELWYNLGKCQFHQDKFRLAGSALTSAVAYTHKRFYAEAWALLGSCYYAVHDLDRAIAAFTNGMSTSDGQLRKECLTARAHTYLAKGDYRVGWEEYEYRLEEAGTWDGTQSLRGKTLLIKAEGGLGDQIFFARYKGFFKKMDHGYVLWEVDEPLADYFKWGLGLETVIRGKEVPEHDLMVHAGSLPYIFGTKQGTIPTFCNNQYYRKNKITNIGLACSGNPLHPDDHHRSIPLAAFEPLLALDKKFYLMQKGVRHTDQPAFKNIVNSDFDDVENMAADMARMDLVITVDTMTAHLAGAEGIPTILLLPYACDWRWGLEGDRTPWYPSIKIIRQGEDRKWEPVIQRVVEELRNA
jgi:hypothetical protein